MFGCRRSARQVLDAPRPARQVRLAAWGSGRPLSLRRARSLPVDTFRAPAYRGFARRDWR